MKDNVSIVFAAILGVILIVILPLFSVLDRQDSMSYNVVLTETTKFVDNIRNNGFIDKDSYYNYISALSATANMYKVEIEVYRKRLIKDVDSALDDVYVEEVELFNTIDVLEVIEGSNDLENQEKLENSNEKNNVYLLKPNDEIYLKVYNTNITAGSVIYKAFSGEAQDKVIDISYGGIVNNINWELFNQINASSIDIPEVVLAIPVNANNKTNIMKVTDYGDLEPVDCNDEANASLCEDGIPLYQEDSYTYLYDLTYKENKKMTIAVELKNMDYIAVGEKADGSLKFAELATLTEQEFNNAKSFIKNNFIQLNEMFANIDLKFRGKDEYYMFDIELTDVEIASVDLLSLFASVSVLPGLGQDKNGLISVGAETVQLELVDESAIHTVTISDPINFEKLVATKNITNSLMTSGEVYENLTIAFIISYTAINDDLDNEAIIEAVKNNIEINGDANYIGLEILTADSVKQNYNINLTTRTIAHVLVKFKYTSENIQKNNYLSLKPGWVETNLFDEEEDYIDEDFDSSIIQAAGAESSKYAVLEDNSPPVAPKILVDGIMGKNGWYIKDNVIITVEPSKTDTIIKSGRAVIGGSGVANNSLRLSGANVLAETSVLQYTIQKEGETIVTASAQDYSENKTSVEKTIKLDKTAPTKPTVEIQGKSGNEGWYTSNVVLKVTPGIDKVSGVEKTTYEIKGAETVIEQELPTDSKIYLTKDGHSKVIITTYDKAGNYSEEELDIYIDKTVPAGVDFTVAYGSKNEAGWYNSDVGINIVQKDNVSPSGIGKLEYEVLATDGGEKTSKTEITTLSHQVKITKSGKYTIKTYMYNKAGNVLVQNYDVSVDKEAPHIPTIEIGASSVINNGWYIKPVDVTITSKGDIGPSTERVFSYITTKNGVSTSRVQIPSPTNITLDQDGVYLYEVFSLDWASNQSQTSKEIKVDVTPPNAAEFDITGIQGENGWYKSDVSITYTGGTDKTSGIKRIDLSKNSVTELESGTTVTLVTEDNAGHIVTLSKQILIDSINPTTPVIKLPTPTGSGVDGVNLYNQGIGIAITPGTDANLDKNTYKVINTETGEEVVKETVGTSLTIVTNGKYKLIATAIDKAGNKVEAAKEIWINKTVPIRPKISYIDGKKITNSSTQTVTGTNSNLEIDVANLEVGNTLNIVATNETTGATKKVTVTITKETQSATINLDSQGTYLITATQKNIYGKTSSVSQGIYKYVYEHEQE